MNETLDQTALRETLEETGVRVHLLPLAIPTLATNPNPTTATVAQPSVQCARVTEPIAVTQRVTNETLKIIFWFAATGDSAVTWEECTQSEDEEFDTIWTPF